MALLATRPGRFRIARLLGMLAGGARGQGAEKESMSMRATDKPFDWRVCLMGAG
jgi:hypothetical protein